jgi:hypothetical protein
MQADHPDDPGLDFPGFGPHSLRRANITRRQEIGSSLEAGIIVGHSDLVPPRNTRKVPLKQQEELTLRVQAKRARAGKKSRSMRRRWRMGNSAVGVGWEQQLATTRTGTEPDGFGRLGFSA